MSDILAGKVVMVVPNHPTAGPLPPRSRLRARSTP
jgi:hypothetical protein